MAGGSDFELSPSASGGSGSVPGNEVPWGPAPSCRSPRGGWRTTRLIREANSFAVSGRPLSGGGRGDVACRFGRAAFPDGAPRASLAPDAVSESWGVPGLLPAGPDLLPAPLLAVFLTTLDGFCGVEDAISGERRSSRSRVRAGAGPEDSDTPSRWGRPMEGAGGERVRAAARSRSERRGVTSEAAKESSAAACPSRSTRRGTVTA